MPVYQFKCECGNKTETIQPLDWQPPKCEKCGAVMVKELTAPTLIQIKHKGGYPIRSKGYKEGYSKEVLRDVLPETHA